VSGRRYHLDPDGRDRHWSFIKGKVCGACDGRKKVMVRTPQGYENVPCPHCGGTGVVVKGKKR